MSYISNEIANIGIRNNKLIAKQGMDKENSFLDLMALPRK
jgi:hypothetical protein